jgi:hypothetical protein
MKAACLACPYRKDVASGVWAQEEYDKLPAYDNPTAEQPFEAFACHAQPESFCHGWAVCHSNRGHEYELIALRFRDAGPIPKPSVPLFRSGTEAALHGMALIAKPNKKAKDTVERLLKRHPRLRGE